MESLNALNSTNNNQNIARDKGAYSQTTKTRPCDIASKVSCDESI